MYPLLFFRIPFYFSRYSVFLLYGDYYTRVRDKKRLEKVGNLVKNSYLYR